MDRNTAQDGRAPQEGRARQTGARSDAASAAQAETRRDAESAAQAEMRRDAASAASLDRRPRVGPGFRLQWEPAQSCHVLLYPEGMVKLNGSAGEIMKRCDGERSVAEIVADLEQTYAVQGLERDVLAFVEIAARQRWLTWDEPR